MQATAESAHRTGSPPGSSFCTFPENHGATWEPVGSPCCTLRAVSGTELTAASESSGWDRIIQTGNFCILRGHSVWGPETSAHFPPTKIRVCCTAGLPEGAHGTGSHEAMDQGAGLKDECHSPPDLNEQHPSASPGGSGLQTVGLAPKVGHSCG